MLSKLAISLLLAGSLALPLSAQSDCSGCVGQPSYFQESCSNELLSGCGGLASGCNGSSCAAPCNCHYASVFGGFSDIDNFERTLDSGPDTFIDGAKFHDDFACGGAIGSQVHPHGRIEFEFTLRDSEVSSWFEQEFDNTGVLVSNNVSPATGDITSYSGMLNILFDLYDRQVGCPGLYLGGGVGSIYVDSQFATATDDYETIDTSFAYQFVSGVNYAATLRVDIFAEYRYLGADYINVDNLTTGQSLGDFTIDTHNVFFGARVRR